MELIYLFIYLFKSDSRSITENKTKQQKLHGIRDTYKKQYSKKINKKLENYGNYCLECLQTLKTGELN